ncbi:MAG TPA: cytochrome c3 family protein, partial [Anaeromyxobacteraceae bacterium]|nr:cytochrome c3 family protein [Anaeromyxobacteraceae bacterium]
MIAASLATAALLNAPTILAPGPGAQTVRDEVRVFAEAGAGATVAVGGGQPTPCATGGKREGIAHCRVSLAPGRNRVVVKDATGETQLLVLRYETTGRLVGADLAGFGEGTLHRPEVEARCARCHAMDAVKGLPRDARLPEPACGTCHGDVTARAQQHGPVGQGACLTCHDAASSPQRYAVAWPIQETCLRCHADIRDAMQRKAWRHGPAAAGRCTTCHDPHGSANPSWLKKPIFELCTNCHPEKASGRHVVVGFVYGDGHPLR